MDFIAQYAAAALVRSGHGGAVLDPAAVQAAEHAAAPERVALLPFVQPPAIALLLAPVAALPFEIAFAVVAALDAALIVVAVALLRPRLGLLGIVALLLAPPAVVAVAQGQTAPLVLLLVAVSVRSRAGPAGLALGLTLLRPQTAALLIVAGLLDPARRVWTILGAALVVGASSVVVGVDGIARYVSVLADASLWSTTGELGLGRAIGWSGLASAIGWSGLAVAGPIVGLMAGVIAVARAAPDARAEVAAAWALVASPHVLMHDGLLAYPALIAIASRRGAWDVIAVAIWLEHVLAAPVAVLWSLTLAVVRSATYPRTRR
jgi:hypothetical protein